MQPEEQSVRIIRLRLGEEMPLLLETSYVPSLLCPGLENEDLESQSLYRLLQDKYGLKLESTRQIMEATIANDYEVQLFGVEPGTAMILLEGLTYAEPELPIEYVKAIYRGDRFKFVLISDQQAVASETAGAHRVSVLMN
jgi:GntR family transcriptional regulator